MRPAKRQQQAYASKLQNFGLNVMRFADVYVGATSEALNRLQRDLQRPEDCRGPRLLRQRVARQVNRENTARASDVPDREHSIVRLDAAPTDCESKSHAGPVLAALLERQKQVLRAKRKAAAMILDLD